MEEVIKHLKTEFEKSMYQVDVQIIYEDYLLKRREAIGVKIAYAIAYLKKNKKVNKEQALEVIFNILAGNL